MPSCSTCGRENPDDARFCANCGSPLGAVPGSAREERKVVTVLFADLVGFTSRSERLDPEDVRATLSPYFARLREELERRGGTVEKFIGDAVMAVFGAPTAHEDDPERAVRAAIAIRDAMAEMNEHDAALDLHVRVGVDTGEALISLGVRPLQGEGMAAGDVVNTAARLQTSAPVDGILVGQATHRATERAIEYRSVDPVEAKGKAEPVAAWEVLEARSSYGVDITRRVDTSLVGRERELALLRDALDRARHQDEPQLVTIVGEPGIGKSRLVHELSTHIEAMPDLIAWRQGRCLPYGDGVSYWALGEMVKAEAGILETDPDGDATAKLDRTVTELITDVDERGWVSRHLRPLVGLPQERGSGEQGSDEGPAAWRRFLEALAERRPTVLIFEDLHWADDGLLDFLDYLIDWTRDVPLLVLCTARPELLTRRPGWGGGKLNAATISLAPLSDEDTARLLAGLLNRALLPAELQAALLARAGGNPLYAEEFARMAANRSAEDLAAVELPGSVQGIIAARLDGLDPDDKSLLQDGSVVGKTFWLGAVAAVGGRDPSDLQGRLHELERGRFVRQARRSSVGAETEYGFLHLLVRDVAYGQIPRGARADKHRAAADWISSLSGERLEDRAELLAHHYLSALELARAAGQDTADLERPARLALRAAGDRAIGLAAYAAAERAYAAAVDLWPKDDPERPMLLFHYGRSMWLHSDKGADILAEARDGLLEAGDVETAAVAELLIGDTVWRLGRGREAQEHFDRAAALIEGRPESTEVAQAKAHLARYLMVTGRSIDAIRVGREALAVAKSLGAEDILAFALNTVGTARVNLGDLGGFDDIEESIEVAGTANLPWHVSRGHINLGVSLFYTGEIARALDVHTRNLEYAQRYGIEGAITWSKAEVALGLFLVGRWDESLAISDAEIARMEAGAPHYLEVQHRQSRARIRQGRGDVDGAIEDAERAVDVGRAAGDPQALLPALAEWARVLFLTGRVDEAESPIDEILRSIDPDPVMDWAWWIVPAAIVLTDVGRSEDILALGGADLPTRWIQAARLWASGDQAGAADRLEDIGSAGDEAYARVKEAERLIAAGHRAEAEPFLSRALELYRGMGATAFIQEAELLLAPPA
ncbi:MAG: AAA family ATPase [Actinobacteria bacterium]|nr:AAA family ATPase [Actinomycetota bacterium]